MRFVAVLSTTIVLAAGQIAISHAAQAQSFRIGPGGVQVSPEPREGDRDRDRDRAEQLGRLHQRCSDGDRRACVSFGFIIGEARERRDDWRRDHREWFWWENER